MNEIEDLIQVTDHLLAPGGCPWDREQTMKSVRTHVLEEVCELIEAIDLEDNQHIKEELGDLLFNAVFLSRLAEKEGRCSLAEVADGIKEKLIRRHPHVFGGEKLECGNAARHQWESIKKEEKGNAHRKSVLDGIPKGLPALARAYKVIRKMRQMGSEVSTGMPEGDFGDEETLGNLLWQIVDRAQEKQIDPEHALRAVLANQEKIFRQGEGGDSHEN